MNVYSGFRLLYFYLLNEIERLGNGAMIKILDRFFNLGRTTEATVIIIFQSGFSSSR